MRWSVLLFLGICFFYQAVHAQTIDVRAYSRQRGFKAYSVKQAYIPPVRRKTVQKQTKSEEEKPLFQAESEHKIQQTGVKVFQEKDEDKVMNFTVDNPEFDKLSDYKKQDLMKRITFKENTD